VRNRGRQAVLALMRSEGEALNLSLEDGKPVWRLLPSGRRVSPRTAQRIIHSTDSVSSEDALFPEMPAQTWRPR
jgi:hypothetical protein